MKRDGSVESFLTVLALWALWAWLLKRALPVAAFAAICFALGFFLAARCASGG